MNFRHFAREQLKRAKQKKRPKKLTQIPPPKGIERNYERKLQPMLQRMHSLVLEHFIPALSQVMRQVQAVRGDSVIDDYKTALDDVRERFGDAYSEEDLEAIARDIAGQVEQHAITAFGHTLDQQLEARPTVGVSMAADLAVDGFADDNVQLITSISERYFDEIRGLVGDAVRSGRGVDDLADEIEERYGVAESRAQLIARDQVSKLNGDITQALQQDVGIESYIWRTSMDDRVRAAHAVLDGREFRWDDPPAVGHPGEDFQCRCTAEPVLPES